MKDPRWQVLADFIRLLFRAHVRSAFYFTLALAHDALPAADPASSRSLSASSSCLQSTSGSLSGKEGGGQGVLKVESSVHPQHCLPFQRSQG